MWLTNFKKQLWQWGSALITASSVTGVLVALRLAGYLQPLEWAVFDQFLRLRPPKPVDQRIVIVEVNESDIQKADRWPVSDATLASLLSSIKQQQPRAIGLNLYRDLVIGTGHQDLTNIFTSTPNLIGIRKVVDNLSSPAINAPKILEQLGQISASDLVIDNDGVIRRSLLSLKDSKGKTVYSLGTKLALTYLKAEGITIQNVNGDRSNVKLGKAFFLPFRKNDGGYVNADAGGYQILADFHKYDQGFRTISMTDVLQGRSPHNFFTDRIVLIGIAADSGGDRYLTPYSQDFFGQPVEHYTGVRIHAEVASQLIRASLDGAGQMYVWSEPWEWLWIFVCSLIGALLSCSSYLRKFPIIIEIVIISGCIVGGSYLIFLQGWWIPVVPAWIGFFCSNFAIASHFAGSFSGVSQILNRYLTEEAVAILVNSPNKWELGGEKRKVVILVSDLRAFSVISERIKPETALDIVNLYLGGMTDVIHQYQGKIYDFIGDCIFAVFDLIDDKDPDTSQAIACAIAMQLAMDDINSKLAGMDLPQVEMGIGIHIGEVLAGNIGSLQRVKYTAIGKHVNLAFRIESYTVGGQILISSEAKKFARDRLRVDGKIQAQPKGLSSAIEIYQISGIAGKYNLNLPEQQENLVQLYQEIPLQYRILEGKHLPSRFFQGSLVSVSASTALLRSDHPLELLSNLQIKLLAKTQKAKGLGDIYAKVVEISVQKPNHFHLRFTAIPPEVAALLDYLSQCSLTIC